MIDIAQIVRELDPAERERRHRQPTDEFGDLDLAGLSTIEVHAR